MLTGHTAKYNIVDVRCRIGILFIRNVATFNNHTYLGQNVNVLNSANTFVTGFMFVFHTIVLIHFS